MLNEKKFQAIYDDFLSSGLTAREYCSNLGMSEAKFYYWKKRLKDQGHSANGFIPLVFEQKQTNHSFVNLWHKFDRNRWHNFDRNET
jgi:hypothetical protein